MKRLQHVHCKVLWSSSVKPFVATCWYPLFFRVSSKCYNFSCFWGVITEGNKPKDWPPTCLMQYSSSLNPLCKPQVSCQFQNRISSWPQSIHICSYPRVRLGSRVRLGPRVSLGPRIRLGPVGTRRVLRMHPHAVICLRHVSICTHIPPYRSTTYQNVNIHSTFLSGSQNVQITNNIAKL